MNIPNGISLVRLLLAPVFLWAHLSGRPGWALALFAVAAASDPVDGLVARVLDQRTALGAFLDPLADKVLALTALGALTAERRVPIWLLGLVLARDGLMAVGALLVRKKRLTLPTSPSRVGKYATVATTLFVVWRLAEPLSPALVGWSGWGLALGFIAGVCIATSTLLYYARFGYLFYAPPKEG